MLISARHLAFAAALSAFVSVSVATNCTDTQLEDTDSTYTTYGTTLDTDCADDICDSACVTTLTVLAGHLPDCEYSDGINYYQSLTDDVELCNEQVAGSGTEGVVGSWSGSASTSDVGEDWCTEDESTQISSYLAEYDAQYKEACREDDCSSACISVMNKLVDVLPDCVDTDGVNYNEGVELLIFGCGGSSSGDVWEDVGASTSDSVGSDSTSGDGTSTESGSGLSGSDSSGASTLAALSAATITIFATPSLLW